MGWIAWMSIAGGLLLLFAFASTYVERLPVSTALLYLVIGVALGPVGLNVISLDIQADAFYVERATELAVIFALFTGGLRLRVRLRDRAWYAAFWLAGPVMIVSIAAIAGLAHVALGLPIATAVLFAAILAPTDPVLASAVSVADAADQDRVRFALSAEAGLNDGTAFPFVVFALGLATHAGVGSWIGSWFVLDVLWATAGALVVGFVLGSFVGRIAIRHRSHAHDTSAPSDFLALALIALTYALAETMQTWGFLAVFAAGVGLRAAELRVVRVAPHPVIDADDRIDNADHPPAENLVAANEPPEALAQPAVAAGVLISQVLSFGDTVERLVEIALVVAVGTVLVHHWDVRAVPIAAALFILIRPLATVLALRATDATSKERWRIGWFGIRGIGSFYYLAYALGHGVEPGRATELVDLTISVVALSVLVHGVTSRPFPSRSRKAQ
jgi:NhaP-type Na+/H+ or K+/H+ antiporter